MWRNTKNYKKYSTYKKNYSNPYFSSSRGRRIKVNRINFKMIIILIIFIILLIFSFWLIFISKIFNIKIIEVNGNNIISAYEIEEVAWGIAGERSFYLFPNNNILIFSKKNFIKKMNDKYNFEKLVVNKEIPNKILITINENKQAAIWHESGRYYYIDNKGYIIKEVDNNVSSSTFPLIDNLGDNKAVDKKIDKQEENIQYIIKLYEEFKNNFYNFISEKFIVDNEFNTIKMKVYQGPQIYFNTTKEVGEQATKLKILISEKLKEDFFRKIYIDLRFGDNIYVYPQ